MSLRVLVANLIMIVAIATGSWGKQQAGATASLIGMQEFPLVLQSSVLAGKTPVGTKIQAKLTIATLFNGNVVPRNAKFFGEIVVSQAKTKNQPSRLSVRMDSVRWENGSAPVRGFLTALFYPSITESQNSQSRPVQMKCSSDPDCHEFWPPPQDVGSSPTSQHLERMKGVDSERTSDGTLALVCRQHTIKLDSSTTYLLMAGDLATSVK